MAQNPTKKRVTIFTQTSAQNGKAVSGSEVLSGFVFMNAKMTDNMKVMEHPIEDGSTITDYEVRNPVEITLEASLIMDAGGTAVSAYNELKQLYLNGERLTVKTALDLYENMLITAIPYDELPTSYNRYIFNLKLKEAIVVQGQDASLTEDQVQNPSDASTRRSGNKQPQGRKNEETENTMARDDRDIESRSSHENREPAFRGRFAK